MITLERVNERKEEIAADITKVEEALTNVNAQQTQLQANLLALRGAIQQVDFFIKECEENNKEDNKETTEDE
ncbi:MAG TPA: hypothetical protein EYP95_07375 [Nitrospinaceae bacterium]|nr:hypothetical protein [Nitrospinaceae bacterium]